jgi:hypothetical protein
MSTDEHDPLTERIIGCAIEVHRTLGRRLMPVGALRRAAAQPA